MVHYPIIITVGNCFLETSDAERGLLQWLLWFPLPNEVNLDLLENLKLTTTLYTNCITIYCGCFSGKIDSNGCTSAFIEEQLNMGLNFILSAEVSNLFLVMLMPFLLQHLLGLFHLVYPSKVVIISNGLWEGDFLNWTFPPFENRIS